MKYFIQTLGCAMNYSDSERVASVLQKLGYERASEPEESDLYLFNTCSIRQKGEDRVYGMMRTLASWKKANPRLLVGLTGCMVRKTGTRNSADEQKDNLLKKLSVLDFVFLINDAQRIGELLAESGYEPYRDDRAGVKTGQKKEKVPDGENDYGSGRLDYLSLEPKYSSRYQAFVPIQIGCDKFCTYCIVPYARGREQSRNMDEILAECENLVAGGCKEITLVGQTVNSYGKSGIDKAEGKFKQYDEPFVELLRRVDLLKDKGLNRVRFTSSHPYDFSDALIKAHGELATLTPHIHLPVQAGDNLMLQRMNRRYTVEDYKKIIEKFREAVPGCSVTTDIIVGFCGETGEQFENTCRLYEDVRFDMAYIARYSPRPGTVSVKAFEDDIPREEKAARWHKLNGILEKCAKEYNESLVGKTQEVLVESFNPETGECEGKSRENKVVQFIGNADLTGTIQKIKITKPLQWVVKGELLMDAGE